ncbi:predicted protein [Naegleria gruberi]|uniref:Predicted protein n=1 Tax=Naegleria gruberi TaxID=5762 RepID=D2W0D4_NAEGR|nr:uncharacterized protein NAEGRDRAFT_81918 [Naegleria gruberi]EFC37413.1 predicted protein [Naegleria gruberi]|eukprot:XP_002670157.1 predicted protein [Naegleria gruberi strain NEG-M]
MDPKKKGELLAPTFDKLQKFSEMITAALFTAPIHCQIYKQKLRQAAEVERTVESENQVQLVSASSPTPTTNLLSTPSGLSGGSVSSPVLAGTSPLIVGVSTLNITSGDDGASSNNNSATSPSSSSSTTTTNNLQPSTTTTSASASTTTEVVANSDEKLVENSLNGGTTTVEASATTTPSITTTTTTTTTAANIVEEEEDKFEARKIEVEVDWESFNELFNTLFNEGAPEVIDTILNSFLSKSCAASLIGTLISQYCKPPQNHNEKSKHVYIRDFLQQNLKKYVIKYSDDPRDVGYYKDGVIVDVVEIEVTQDETIQWIFRDITKNLDRCTDIQQFIIEKYYIPEFERRILNEFLHPLKLQVNWDHMKYAAFDYPRAVERIYKEQSQCVLEQVYLAMSDICAYEEDDLVDALSLGLTTIAITLQPSPHSGTGERPKKDFDIHEATRTLTLRLVLEGHDMNGMFFRDELKPIIKLAGLYSTDITPLFKFEILASAAQLYKVREYADLSGMKRLLSRPDLNWWTPTEVEKSIIDKARVFINENIRRRDSKKSGSQHSNDENIMNNYEDDGMGEDEGYDDDENMNNPYHEEIIKGWHVIKVNKHQINQDRYLILTDKAYWTLKYDAKTGFDPKHFKRHDICNFYFTEQGDIENTKNGAIQALKVYLHEKRKKGMISAEESAAIVGNGRKGSISVRASMKFTTSAAGQQFAFLQTLSYQLLQDSGIPRTRVKKKKAERARPERNKDVTEYASLFLPHSEEKEFDVEDIKSILTEISWCLFAVANANSKRIHPNYKVIEPFFSIKDFTVPKSKWFSPFVNMFKSPKKTSTTTTTKEKKIARKDHGKSGHTDPTKEDEEEGQTSTTSGEFVTKKQPLPVDKQQHTKPILKIRQEEQRISFNPNFRAPATTGYTPTGVIITKEDEEKGQSRRITFKATARVFYTGNEEDQNTGFYAVEEDLIDEEVDEVQ